MHRVPHGARTAGALALAFLCALAPRVSSAVTNGGPGVCAPPRTRVAIAPFADQSGGAWQLMSGVSPARLVAARLADSLEHVHGRSVINLSLSDIVTLGGAWPGRQVDDVALLAAARRASAEVILTGVVTAFVHEDRREPGRFGRWGMGAPDARSRAEIAVTLRVLDARDGSVVMESRAARERVARTTSSARSSTADPAVDDALIEEALQQVLGDLMRTLAARLDARWQARVIGEGRGGFVIDAGSARGLFAGERLEVWRSGIEILDEDLMRIAADVRTGAVVVEAIGGLGSARVRLVEGDVRRGDSVRPCSGAGALALSARR